MRKLFLTIAILSFMVTRSQVVKEKVKPVLPQKPEKLAPIAPEKKAGSPATPVTKPARRPTAAVAYYLRAVTVVVHTGNDNKEMLSTVTFTLSRKAESRSTTANGQSNSDITLFTNPPSQLQKNIEFRINSSNDIMLQSSFTPENKFREPDINQIEKNGLRLAIRYHPNFAADTWKVDKVSLVLRVQDAEGNSHPALDYKVIRFSRRQLLTNHKPELVCETDGALLSKP